MTKISLSLALPTEDGYEETERSPLVFDSSLPSDVLQRHLPEIGSRWDGELVIAVNLVEV